MLCLHLHSSTLDVKVVNFSIMLLNLCQATHYLIPERISLQVTKVTTSNLTDPYTDVIECMKFLFINLLMYENFIFICRSVEDINQEVSEKYHLKFLQNVACMEDSLNRFIQDSLRFCSGLQTNLGMFRI